MPVLVEVTWNVNWRQAKTDMEKDFLSQTYALLQQRVAEVAASTDKASAIDKMWHKYMCTYSFATNNHAKEFIIRVKNLNKQIEFIHVTFKGDNYNKAASAASDEQQEQEQKLFAGIVSDAWFVSDINNPQQQYEISAVGVTVMQRVQKQQKNSSAHSSEQEGNVCNIRMLCAERKETPHWLLFAGKRMLGQDATPADTIIREFQEETNYVLPVGLLINNNSIDSCNSNNAKHHAQLFLTQIIDKIQTKQCGIMYNPTANHLRYYVVIDDDSSNIDMLAIVQLLKASVKDDSEMIDYHCCEYPVQATKFNAAYMTEASTYMYEQVMEGKSINNIRMFTTLSGDITQARLEEIAAGQYKSKFAADVANPLQNLKLNF